MTFQSDVSVSRHQTSLAPWGSKGPRNQGGESDRICVSCLLVVFPCHAACCKCKLCSPSLLYISSCMPHVKYSSCSRSIYTGLKFDVTKSKTFFGGFLTIGRRFCHSFTASIAGTFSPHLRTRGKRSTTHSFSPILPPPPPPQRRHSITRTLRTTYILPLVSFILLAKPISRTVEEPAPRKFQTPRTISTQPEENTLSTSSWRRLLSSGFDPSGQFSPGTWTVDRSILLHLATQ
jgi:hypothetical protein